jgi:para-nitrobenzyl esterase
MGSESARGLFHKAICQSGSSLGDYYALEGLTGSWVQAAHVGAALQEAQGSQTLAEMRAISAAELYDTAYNLGIYCGPVMDGVFIKDSWRKNLKDCGMIDLMIGTMAQDGWGFNDPITSVQDYEDHLQIQFHDLAPEVLARYPAEDAEQAAIQDALTSTAAGFTQPARYIARAVAGQNLNVYRYLCTFVPPTEQGAYFGCYHSAEIAYVFGNLNEEKGYGPEDKSLSETMMGYWTHFARSGNANAQGLPEWPIYTDREPILVIDADEYPVINGYMESDCDYFATMSPDAQPDYPVVQ